MILKGDITTLRSITIEDAALTFAWRSSARARFLQQGSNTVDEQRAWIDAKLKTSELNFIIEYSDRAVGMIALLDINHLHKSAQAGRLLVGEEEFVGKAPVAFEAERLLYDYAFDVLHLHKIYGDIMEDNHGMLKTKFYLGFKQDGILRDHYVYDGVFKNTVAVSILEDEYREVCRPKLLSLIKLFSGYK
jgi:RimJ/RimL family protein N-acetyltransferase